jgi:hypothetical protein
MKITAEIRGKPLENDTRCLSYWVGDLRLKAAGDFDPYFMAAICNALHGNDSELYNAIEKSATKLLVIHSDRVKKLQAKEQASE